MAIGSELPATRPLVLLIEDDPLVRLGQEILLRDWGYRVFAGADRNSIFTALQGEPAVVAAILADFNLGGPETGADLALAVAEAAGRLIPTMIMSASLGRSSSQAATSHGFDFCVKPVNINDLCIWLASVTS